MAVHLVPDAGNNMGSRNTQHTATLNKQQVYQMSLLSEDVDTLANFYTLKAANILRYSSSLIGGTCVATYNCALLAAWGYSLREHD